MYYYNCGFVLGYYRGMKHYLTTHECQYTILFINPQEFSGEVDKTRSEFESVLSSCDLFDTPFDATRFEAGVSTLQDKINHCEKVSVVDITNSTFTY